MWQGTISGTQSADPNLPADSMLPESYAADSNNIWGCYHVNSVEEKPNNTLLISMRNMWAIYNIDKDKNMLAGIEQ